MTRRQHEDARTGYGRRMQTRADDQRIVERGNRRVAAVSGLTAGLSMATGNWVLGAAAASLASVSHRQARESGAYGRALNAKGRAVEDLVARRQGWDLRSNILRHHEPVRTFAAVKGVSETVRPTSSVAPMPGANGIDALAYAAGSASVVAGGQMARDVRKSAPRRAPRPATDQAVVDAKAVADGAKARGTRKAAVAAPPAQPGLLQRGAVTMARLNPLMMAAGGTMAASNAWNAVRDAGGDKRQAAMAAGAASAPMAAAIAAPTLLGRYAPSVAAAVSRAALPLMAASTGLAAFRGGRDAYARGDGAAGIAKGALMGAADSLTFGLASKVAGALSAGRAYRNDAAAAKDRDRATSQDASVRQPGRSAAPPQSDGTTAGYTRTDPRSGKTVTVQEYRTPSR